MAVHFDLILANKSTPPVMPAFEIVWESRRDGFLFYAKLSNILGFWKKSVVVQFFNFSYFLILAFHDDIFVVIFSNI